MSEGPPKPHESQQFPPRICPKCSGEDLPCDLCHGTRKVSHFLAAAWLSEHPEYPEESERAPDTDKEPEEG